MNIYEVINGEAVLVRNCSTKEEALLIVEEWKKQGVVCFASED